jgi:hypothetical protein
MAIAVIYRPPAMTAEQYNQSWNEGPPVALPTGLLFHAGIGESEAFSTVTVWESREAFDAFAPIFKKAMTERGFHLGNPVILTVHHHLP